MNIISRLKKECTSPARVEKPLLQFLVIPKLQIARFAAFFVSFIRLALLFKNGIRASPKELVVN
ncbi:hypothetical protein KXD93_09140 [Mucilaginibacter sp. BJC16-A38]|uniref:hypothetical protein n=1 Tax=Mucilaginibacter phenanthrenivorans TaxID=1234842 RepID=UPI0021575472|nr:hypothetical protein [Mucilaginibacter phenanthrenivorans]MCR8557805.1 hypothetical protein [Mucilaginibacter phenanthrenivorans]